MPNKAQSIKGKEEWMDGWAWFELGPKLRGS